MAKNTVKGMLIGYEHPVYSTDDGGSVDTGIKFTERTLSGSITSGKKRFLNSAVVWFFKYISELIAYTATRAYGAMFLSYGLLTVIIGLGKEYFGATGGSVVFSTVAGAVFALFAIPLLLSEKPFCIALQDFALTDIVFFEFFCIKRMYRRESEHGIPLAVMVILGVLFAGAGVFFDIEKVLWVILAVTAVYLSFVSPEFTFFSSIIILPMLPLFEQGYTVLIFMIAAAAVSLARKVLFGKRVYSIEQYDILMAAFMICMLAGGIFVGGLDSLGSSLLMILFTLGYSLASNLITNRRLAECALNAVLISSVPAAFYAIYGCISVLAEGGAEAYSAYAVGSTFGEPGAYAAFLVIAVLVSVYFVKTTSNKAVKLIYVSGFVLNFICLLLTRQPVALLALIIGAAAYFIMRYGKRLALFAGFFVFVPFLLFLLPDGAFDLITSAVGGGLTKAEYIELWSGSVKMLSDNLFGGVGIGGGHFAEKLADYTDAVAENSSSLLIEIACEAGVLALVFFLALMIIRLLHRLVYTRYVINSHISTLSYFTSATVFSLIALGMLTYIWSNSTVYYLFWCIFGIGSAALRIAKREHDDRVMYYGDLMSVDTSVVDVNIE